MDNLEREILKAINANPELANDWYVKTNYEQIVKGIASLYRAVAGAGDPVELLYFDTWVEAIAKAHLETFNW